MCGVNGLVFHKKSADMGPILVKKSLEVGPIHENATKTVKSAFLRLKTP